MEYRWVILQCGVIGVGYFSLQCNTGECVVLISTVLRCSTMLYQSILQYNVFWCNGVLQYGIVQWVSRWYNNAGVISEVIHFSMVCLTMRSVFSKLQ